MRELLIAHGYKPVARRSGDGCYQYEGVRCLGYPEAEDCSGSGLGFCKMRWYRNNETVEVITVSDYEVLVRSVKHNHN